MKLEVFQSDKGDCLLLEGADGKHMLIDGGMRDSYTRHVALTLGRMRRDKIPLDVVYVSHVDRDHVFGILQMLEDLVEWRVHKHFRTNPSPGRRNRKPKVEPPPEILGIWHNAFHEQLGANSGRIRSQLAATARVLRGFSSGKLGELADGYQELASSMADAIEVTKRVGSKQLKIPVNKPANNKVMLRPRTRSTLSLGGMTFQILGPSEADLEKLRDEWTKWLKEHSTEQHLNRIRRRHRRDQEALASSSLEGLQAARTLMGNALGTRTAVTTQNLASLMFLVEENGKTLLLTGDGHGEDILAGLKHFRRIGRHDDDSLHVNLLKIPHHGAEHNTDEQFYRKVIADDYIFCGDGAHHNPDLEILEAIAKSRIGSDSERSSHLKAGSRCRFWFSSSSSNPNSKSSRRNHMKDVEEKMRDINRRSNKRIRFTLLEGDHDKLTITI